MTIANKPLRQTCKTVSSEPSQTSLLVAQAIPCKTQQNLREYQVQARCRSCFGSIVSLRMLAKNNFAKNTLPTDNIPHFLCGNRVSLCLQRGLASSAGRQH